MRAKIVHLPIQGGRRTRCSRARRRARLLSSGATVSPSSLASALLAGWEEGPGAPASVDACHAHTRRRHPMHSCGQAVLVCFSGKRWRKGMPQSGVVVGAGSAEVGGGAPRTWACCILCCAAAKGFTACTKGFRGGGLSGAASPAQGEQAGRAAASADPATLGEWLPASAAARAA